METIKLNNAQKVAGINLVGSVIEISAFDQVVSVDLQENQQSTALTIDIMLKNGKLVAGKGDFYIASVKIPPKQYTEVEIGQDEDGNPIMELQQVDNLQDSQIILWDLSNIPTSKTEQ